MDALLLDLNGTLSNDEDVLYRVYADLFGEAGIPFSEERYRSELLGLSDEEMFVQVLGAGADVPALLTERVRRYIAAVEQAPTVTAEVRAAVLHAAARVPVAVVTSAWHEEADAVLTAAGLDGTIAALVCADDVEHMKPSPEPYLRACRLLEVAPSRAVAVEDSPAGVTAAKAAGIRCAALTTSVGRERLAHADLLLDRLDSAAVDLLLG